VNSRYRLSQYAANGPARPGTGDSFIVIGRQSSYNFRPI